MSGNLIRIAESGKFLHVESGIRKYGIVKTAQGFRNPTDDWNPQSSSTDKLESNTWNLECTAWNPESNT